MVMFLSVVANEGDVMPPHVFTKGLRVQTYKFINVLETVIKPWMDYRYLKIAKISFRRTAPMLITGRGHKTSSRRTNRRCERRKSCLPSCLTPSFWTTWC